MDEYLRMLYEKRRNLAKTLGALCCLIETKGSKQDRYKAFDKIQQMREELKELDKKIEFVSNLKTEVIVNESIHKKK